MKHWISLPRVEGLASRQAHADLPEGTYERELGREGFYDNLAFHRIIKGFVIQGDTANDRAGFSVSSAGDVNGDGFDDLIIGAYAADPNGKNIAGESYLVFGGTANQKPLVDSNLFRMTLEVAPGTFGSFDIDLVNFGIGSAFAFRNARIALADFSGVPGGFSLTAPIVRNRLRAITLLLNLLMSRTMSESTGP